MLFSAVTARLRDRQVAKLKVGEFSKGLVAVSDIYNVIPNLPSNEKEDWAEDCVLCLYTSYLFRYNVNPVG